jgi:hypothetical protein
MVYIEDEEFFTSVDVDGNKVLFPPQEGLWPPDPQKIIFKDGESAVFGSWGLLNLWLYTFHTKDNFGNNVDVIAPGRLPEQLFCGRIARKAKHKFPNIDRY